MPMCITGGDGNHNYLITMGFSSDLIYKSFFQILKVDGQGKFRKTWSSQKY
jgi:hypothetical protein